MAQEAAIPITTIREIARQIAAEEVAKFARSGFLRNARITGKDNGLTVSDGARFRVQYPQADGGHDAFYVGDIYDDGADYVGTGALFEQPDGTDIAQFRTDVATGKTRAFINDAAGETVFGADGPGGAHIGRPWLDAVPYRARFADWPSTTSGPAAWETVWAAVLYKQHAKLAVGVRASMDTTGTTGEVRLLVNGVQVGATSPRGFAIADSNYLESVSGAHGASLFVEIQGRRTSATGALRMVVPYIKGVPSDAA